MCASTLRGKTESRILRWRIHKRRVDLPGWHLPSSKAEPLTDLSPTEWRAILTRLRRARLLAGEDPHNPGQLDTHPLVREYFGEQLRSQQVDAWKECNERLFEHYRTIAPEPPTSFKEMEPLFLAVISGCNAGLFRRALHEVYIPRIQREDSSFAANGLGARGALLLVLGHFFEKGRWGSPAETGVEGQSLTSFGFSNFIEDSPRGRLLCWLCVFYSLLRVKLEHIVRQICHIL